MSFSGVRVLRRTCVDIGRNFLFRQRYFRVLDSPHEQSTADDDSSLCQSQNETQQPQSIQHIIGQRRTKFIPVTQTISKSRYFIRTTVLYFFLVINSGIVIETKHQCSVMLHWKSLHFNFSVPYLEKECHDQQSENSNHSYQVLRQFKDNNPSFKNLAQLIDCKVMRTASHICTVLDANG